MSHPPIKENSSFSPFPASRQAELLGLLRQVARELLAKRSVIAVDVGYVWESGVLTDEIGLRTHVRRKRPKQVVDATDLVPESIDGVRVDVLPSRRIHHAGTAHDPIVGGSETNTFRIGGRGTLGAVVYHLEETGEFALSNYHVFGKGLGDGTIGADVHQPASGLQQYHFGDIYDFDPVLDCAIARLNGTRHGSTEVIGLTNRIAGVESPNLGTVVAKSGATTGVTAGIVEGVSRRDQFTIISRPTEGLEIARKGDSGSVWINPENDNAVGLHFAGDVENGVTIRAWAKQMTQVCKRLKIRF